MTRRDFIEKLAEFYEQIPRGASSYHICDMLTSYGERIGGVMPTVLECGDSGMCKVTDILDYSELDYKIKWEDEEESDV